MFERERPCTAKKSRGKAIQHLSLREIDSNRRKNTRDVENKDPEHTSNTESGKRERREREEGEEKESERAR